LSLYIDDHKVGEGRIKTQPGNFSLVGEGSTSARTPARRSLTTTPGTRPFGLRGGTIHHAIVDVSGESFRDLELEGAMMMARE
jgi:arylsulfatase